MIRSRPWLMPLLLIPLAAAILLAGRFEQVEPHDIGGDVRGRGDLDRRTVAVGTEQAKHRRPVSRAPSHLASVVPAYAGIPVD